MAIASRALFVGLYVLFMIPTYVFPYFGSNSAVGMWGNPFFFLHLLFMLALIVLALLRGLSIGKAWIALCPFAALVFDLTPGLSVVPIVPTVLHIAVLIASREKKVKPDPIG